MGDLNKTRYTHRDYESIKKDLIGAIPSLTQEWTSREESDPGIVLIKLMSMLGDNLSYNVDKNVLELFLSTVTQRKNCSKILSLLGYKMHWYRSATVGMQIRLSEEYDYEGNPNHIVLHPFKTTFRSSNGDVVYTLIDNGPGSGDIDILSSSYNTMINLVEGRVVKVTFNKNSLVNNRYYFAETNIDETHLWLTFGSSHVFELVDNLYLVTDDTQGSFEFNVDEYDRPYIELVKYWEDIVGNTSTTAQFTLYYVLSSGSRGNIARNQLTQVQDISGSYTTGYVTNYGIGDVTRRVTASSLLITSHPGTTSSLEDLQEANQFTSSGYDPQTVETAKEDSANYVFTHSTLVTANDYEKAARRVTGISSSKVLDNVIIEYEGLDPAEIASRCDDDFGTVQEENKDGKVVDLLKSYQVIMYLLFLGADSEANPDSGVSNSSNAYSLPSSEYYFKSYNDFNDRAPEEGSPFYSLGFFPYKPITFVTTQVTDLINDADCLSCKLDFGTSKIFPFRVKGTIYLNEPISPQDTLLVLDNVDTALNEFYYPGNGVGYGEQPRFMDLVETIQGADINIKYFDSREHLIEWSKICDLDKFDSTSFAKYNGLHEKFTIDKQYLRFRIKNTSSAPVLLKNLTVQRNPGTDPDLPDDSVEWVKIPGRSYKVIEVETTPELKAFCTDLRLNTSLSYVR